METFKDSHDAKIYLERRGFPCFYGDTLSYVQIANIFQNKGLGKDNRPPNQVNATEALEQDSCAGCEGSRNRNLIECDVCGKRLR